MFSVITNIPVWWGILIMECCVLCEDRDIWHISIPVSQFFLELEKALKKLISDLKTSVSAIPSIKRIIGDSQYVPRSYLIRFRAHSWLQHNKPSSTLGIKETFFNLIKDILSTQNNKNEKNQTNKNALQETSYLMVKTLNTFHKIRNKTRAWNYIIFIQTISEVLDSITKQ